MGNIGSHNLDLLSLN